MWIWTANKFAKFHVKKTWTKWKYSKKFGGLLFFWNTLYTLYCNCVSEHAGNVKVLHAHSYESYGWAAWSDGRCKYGKGIQRHQYQFVDVYVVMFCKEVLYEVRLRSQLFILPHTGAQWRRTFDDDCSRFHCTVFLILHTFVTPVVPYDMAPTGTPKKIGGWGQTPKTAVIRVLITWQPWQLC